MSRVPPNPYLKVRGMQRHGNLQDTGRTGPADQQDRFFLYLE